MSGGEDEIHDKNYVCHDEGTILSNLIKMYNVVVVLRILQTTATLHFAESPGLNLHKSKPETTVPENNSLV